MRTLELQMKFSKEDTIYTTKQTPVENVCNICEGNGVIIYNNKNMRCPECAGKGKFISSKKIYTVCEEPFIVSTIKVSISNNGNATVRYKGRCGFSNLNRSEENLFLTKEEAKKRCDELNREKSYMLLSDILIPESFKATQPSVDKIQAKLDYFKNHNKFDNHIVINRENELKDGYINYLLCNLLNINTVNVVIEREDDIQ
ncbi:putative molecular chaperone [Psychrobacillus phage Perkons]|nr:putative molecular chaperone [Psychrobacillus phage Perkons]